MFDPEELNVEESGGEVQFEREIDGHFNEAVIAFHDVFDEVFDRVEINPKPDNSIEGEDFSHPLATQMAVPNAMRQSFEESSEVESKQIQVAPDRHATVYEARFEVPELSGHFTYEKIEGQGLFDKLLLEAKLTHGERMAVDMIQDAIEEQIEKNSIYEGEALKVGFGKVFGMFSMMFGLPSQGRSQMTGISFMDLGSVDRDSVVYPESVEKQIESSLFQMVTDKKKVEEAGIDWNRTVLLEGDYGTGKTLTAEATAKLAKENGITFVHVKDPKYFKEAQEFAARYQPWVVFAEDVDQAVDSDDEYRNREEGRRQNRTEVTKEITDCLDGIAQKDLEILTVFTTNHPEEITEVLLRHGRVDALISFETLDSKAAKELADQHLNGKAEKFAPMLKDEVPASAVETMKRAKLMALNEDSDLEKDHLKESMESLRRHEELLKKSSK